MAVDTPATIAIVGAGPIGLEAALYARFLGYDVLVFERDAIASNVTRCGSTPMLSPFAANSSSLGLAALHAQDSTYHPPGPDQWLTASDWVDRYLLPLASTDLLDDKIHVGHRVLAIGRPDALKTDPANDQLRADQPFDLLVTSEEGGEQLHSAEVVIDASGVHGEPGGLGPGGLPAVGERAVRANIDYAPRDWLGAARDDYANRHVLVFGDGLLAARAVIALTQLAADAPDTRVTWITRRGSQDNGPLAARPDASVPGRTEIFQTANRLACDGHPSLRWAHGHAVTAISYDDQRQQFCVALTGDLAGQLQTVCCEHVVADVPFHSDLSLLRELHVTPCPVDESICGRGGGAASGLVLDEPDFYVLGAKSRGRAGDFLYTAGLEQIRDLFAIIGDRADLDLYANALKLPR